MADQKKRLQLKHIRASLGVTQAELAQAAGVSEPTIIDSEKNRIRLRLTTAYSILNALNGFLEAKNREKLEISDLTWRVQGEPQTEEIQAVDQTENKPA